jgi:hypothetical protein
LQAEKLSGQYPVTLALLSLVRALVLEDQIAACVSSPLQYETVKLDAAPREGVLVGEGGEPPRAKHGPDVVYPVTLALLSLVRALVLEDQIAACVSSPEYRDVKRAAKDTADRPPPP